MTEREQALIGVRHLQAQRHEEARKVAEAILKKNPREPISLMLMGSYNHVHSRINDAISYYERSLKAEPGVPHVLINLAKAYGVVGNHLGALNAYKELLNKNPNNPEILTSMAESLHALKLWDQAEQALRKALELQPANPMAHLLLGQIAQDKNANVDLPIAHCMKAIEINPQMYRAYNELGNLLLKAGDPRGACTVYENVLTKTGTESGPIYSNLLLSLEYREDISPEALFQHHVQFQKRYATTAPRDRSAFNNPPTSDRKLRIGFLSGDLYTHPVFYFLNSLFSEYDRDQFTFICFSDLAEHKEDENTALVRENVDEWYRTASMSLDDMDALILDKKIDILVDLVAHTGNNRMPIYMKRAAPVQVSWLGYPDTTGLDTMDYRIVDEITDPEPWADKLASEELYRIPAPFLCFQPNEHWHSLEIKQELTPGKITFGTFNRFPKISQSAINLWCEILKQIPEAELLIKSRPTVKKRMENFLQNKAKEFRIEEHRMKVMDFVNSKSSHLENYNAMDVALDTFPYNGTTTTLEGLWMGVPLIAKEGNRHCARVGMSLMQALGMEDWIAHSDEEYIQKAVDIANNRDQLLKTKKNLRNQLLNSPLCDSKAFAQKFETALKSMWQKWSAEKLAETS